MLHAFYQVVTPYHLMLVVLGTVLGVAVGAIPGLTGAMLIALSLPLTFAMQGDEALALLVSMYVGSVSGGLISATLLKIPGTPASMMTTMDGYPLAQSGKAKRALGLGTLASLVGGLVGWLFLLLFSRPLATLSLSFGPFEFFAVVLVALVLIASVSGKSLSKGLLSAGLGMLLALPGIDPASGQPRLTFGLPELDDGFKLLPVLIGLFAICQVFKQVSRSEVVSDRIDFQSDQSPVMQAYDFLKHGVNMIRSALLGVFIGILPGIGANIGSVVAYSVAKSTSKRKKEFGHGSESGIVAPEAANNATVGGALIPLIAMGIPGSVIDTILLGAMTIHGLQPGPLFMQQNPTSVTVVMFSVLLANVIMFLFMLLFMRWLAKLSDLPAHYLYPAILVMCVVGTYGLSNRMFDVWVMLGFGVVGILFSRIQIPSAPFVIGFVLAPIAEENAVEGLMQSGGSWLPLITRPIALSFLLAAVMMLILVLWQRHFSDRARRIS